MFEKVWAWIKSHPWMTAGIALITFIVLYVITSSSSSGGGAVSSNPGGVSDAVAAAQINAGASLQAAQLGAQAQQQQLSTEATLATAQIAAQLDATKSGNATAISLAQIAASSNKDIATLQAQTVNSQTAAAASTAAAQIAAANAQHLDDNKTAVAIQSSNNTTQVQLTGLMTAAEITALQDQLTASVAGQLVGTINTAQAGIASNAGHPVVLADLYGSAANATAILKNLLPSIAA